MVLAKTSTWSAFTTFLRLLRAEILVADRAGNRFLDVLNRLSGQLRLQVLLNLRLDVFHLLRRVVLDFDDVITELRLYRLTHLAHRLRERRLFEWPYHLAMT